MRPRIGIDEQRAGPFFGQRKQGRSFRRSAGEEIPDLGFGPVALTGAPAPAFPDRTGPKGVFAMLYGEPETARFLAAVQRLKRQRRRKDRQTRLAKQRVRAVLRKMRDG